MTEDFPGTFGEWVTKLPVESQECAKDCQRKTRMATAAYCAGWKHVEQRYSQVTLLLEKALPLVEPELQKEIRNALARLNIYPK